MSRRFFLRCTVTAATLVLLLHRLVALGSIVATAGLGACASEDPEVERRGGPLPMEEGDCVPEAGPTIPYCDAQRVIDAKCHSCHDNPTKFGAPVPFVTYEDTQVPYPTGDQKYWQVMITAVDKGFMPFLAANTFEVPPDPLAEPLTDDEKATLLGWLRQCAKPTGGTDCQ